MDIQEQWEKALKFTEIIRPRVSPLSQVAATHLPYIFLAESAINSGDSVVRKGEVMVEKPAIILPLDMPQFDGFDPEKGVAPNFDMLTNFLLVRGLRFPSMKYHNKTESLEVFEGSLSQAIEHHKQLLQREENLSSGLVIGPEDLWQFSVLIFIGNQMIRQADGDMRKLFDDWKKKG